MITIQAENYNHISQDFYNNTVYSIDLSLVPCTCGHSGCLIRHGSYKRNFQLEDGIVTLCILRVYCKNCGHTHALLLSSMVPYSQIPLKVQYDLIHSFENGSSLKSLLNTQCCIDESNLRFILHNYRRIWRERLSSLCMLPADIQTLISECFSHFSRQFMQIKITPNILFLPPT